MKWPMDHVLTWDYMSKKDDIAISALQNGETDAVLIL
jgi:hypothetical protein